MFKMIALWSMFMVADAAYPGNVPILCFTPAKTLYDVLRGREWKEVPVWRGLASDTVLVQVWSSKKSWTITIQSTDLPDTACMLWNGEGSELLEALRGEKI